MAKFYGQVNGGRTSATRTGHSGITASCQSYNGSVITSLNYNKDGKLMVNLSIKEDESTYWGRTVFYGTFEDFVKKFKED